MTPSVPPSGPIDARLVVLGESPGTREVEEGKPFVGPSGEILNRALMGQRDRVRVTNVRKTKPSEGQSRAERLAEIDEAWPGLMREFAAYRNARVVLVVGADALRAVLGTEAISRFHLSQFTRMEAEAIRAVSKSNVLPLGPEVHTVAVVLHPAFALQGNRGFLGEIGVGIGRAFQASLGDVGPERANVLGRFDLRTDVRGIHGRLDRPATKTVCIDVEGREKVDLVGVGFANGETFVGPFDDEMREVVGRIFAAPLNVVGHNFLFDLALFAKEGLRPTKARVRDTIAAAALLCPPQPQSAQKGSKGTKGPSRLSLAACVTRWVGGSVNWKNPDDPLTQAIYRASFPSVPPWLWPRLYCGLDVWHNLRMWWQVERLLRKEGMF